MKIKQTWAYKHKHLLFTLSLLVALIWQSHIITIPWPQNTEAYVQTPAQLSPLDKQIEQRAIELRDQFKDVDLEIYRQKAIVEMNAKLLEVSKNSPFLDKSTMAEYGL